MSKRQQPDQRAEHIFSVYRAIIIVSGSRTYFMLHLICLFLVFGKVIHLINAFFFHYSFNVTDVRTTVKKNKAKDPDCPDQGLSILTSIDYPLSGHSTSYVENKLKMPFHKQRKDKQRYTKHKREQYKITKSLRLGLREGAVA